MEGKVSHYCMSINCELIALYFNIYNAYGNMFFIFAVSGDGIKQKLNAGESKAGTHITLLLS